MEFDDSRIDRNDSAEYFWGGELTRDAPELVWDMKSDINEDEDDDDFAIHTLFLKLATLGKSAVSNEQNIVQVESMNFSNTVVKQPLLNMLTGVNNTVPIDMSFAGKFKTVFRLVEGSGPVYLSGQHLVELPKDDYSQDESLYDEDMPGISEELDDDDEDESEDENKSKAKGKSKKRRNSSSPHIKLSKAKQKSKMETREDSESDDEEEGDDDEDDEDMDTSVMKKKKGKAGGTQEGQKKDKKGSISSVKIPSLMTAKKRRKERKGAAEQKAKEASREEIELLLD